MACIFFALLAFATPSAAQPAKPDKLIASIGPQGWPPFLIRAEKPEDSSGIMLEVLRRITKRTGVQLQIVEYPEKRAMAALGSDKLHVYFKSPNWVHNPRSYLWSDSVLDISEVVISRRAAPYAPDDITSDQSLTLGTVLGFLYPEFSEGFMSGRLSRSDCSTPYESLRMLQLRRVDAVLDCEYVTRYYMRNNPSFRDEFVISKPYTPKHGYCFVFGNTQELADYLPIFNAELARMKKNGELQEIIESYIGSTPK